MSKNTLTVASIFFATTAITFISFYFAFFTIWQERLFDKFFIAKQPPDNVVIFAIDNESIGKIGQWPWSRSVFANAINKLQDAKVVSIDVNFSEVSKTDSAGDLALATAIQHAKPKIILPAQVNLTTKEVVMPLPNFQQGSLVGQVNIISEDGIARKVNNFQENYTSFGALTALEYDNHLTIPSVMRIDYEGKEKTFTTLPINDLLENKIPKRIYENKIVLIGAIASDLHDFFGTPFGQLPGVEVNANIISTLLSQKFYQETPPLLALLFMGIINLLATWLIVKVKGFQWLIGALVATFIAINVMAMALFYWHIIFPILYADIGFLITSGAIITFQYTLESKEKRFIHNSFKYYLSEEVIEELLQNPKKLALGGERKKITVFFSDVRGFSGISEVLSPEDLTYVLSEYMTEMTDIIMAHKGLVAQYFGDGIMAFWGAPLEDKNQAENSCLATLAMWPALEKLNARLKQENFGIELKIGVGINTAQVTAGNIGSKKKFNYTVFGDGVNLTSRLEGLNKAYGTSIIITESTKKEIEHNPAFHIRELDVIIVKGKKESKLIFEVMLKPLDKDVLTHFNNGRKYYKEGNWQKAIEEFSFGADVDGPSKLFLARCQDFLKHPPENWNGIYEFTTK